MGDEVMIRPGIVAGDFHISGNVVYQELGRVILVVFASC